MSYLLVGNYGVGNLGDEALREYFLKRFSDAGLKVVSASPSENELHRLPCGVRSLFSFRWIKTIRALRKSDGVIFGGGSLFTDVESVWACVIWWVHVFFARLLGKKVILAFQGIGPFRTWIGKRLAQSAVCSAHFISVRDPQSFARVQDWKIGKNITQTFDPVFALIEGQEPDLNAQKILIVIPRENSDNLLQTKFDNLLQSDRFEEVRILSLKPDDRKEESYCRDLQESVTVASSVIGVRTINDLSSAVAGGSFVLTQRFHGAIVALALGKEIEVIPQGKSDKLDVLAELLNSEPARGRKERLRALVDDGERALKEVL